MSHWHLEHRETISSLFSDRLHDFITFILPFLQEGTIIFLSVQTFHPLILAVWPLVVPLFAASTLALGHRWHLASPARWEEWAPGSWGCAVAPGMDDPPTRPWSPEAYLGPRQCPPASATALSATRYAPGGGEQQNMVNEDTNMHGEIYFKYTKSVFLCLCWLHIMCSAANRCVVRGNEWCITEALLNIMLS